MVELISIHIEKTGGTSLRNTLEAIYGADGIQRIDLYGKKRMLPPRANHDSSVEPPLASVQEPLIARLLSSGWLAPLRARIPGLSRAASLWQASSGAVDSGEVAPLLRSTTRVIHGHFQYAQIIDMYGLSRDIPIMTWLRDPVERVISHYYYFHEILMEVIEKTRTPQGVLRRMERSLIEYARANVNRNRMALFMEGLDLRNLLFVGILEHMEEDLSDLAEILGWKSYKPFFVNKTAGARPKISKDIRQEIASLNEKDMELYSTALELRRERRARIGGADA